MTSRAHRRWAWTLGAATTATLLAAALTFAAPPPAATPTAAPAPAAVKAAPPPVVPPTPVTVDLATTVSFDGIQWPTAPGHYVLKAPGKLVGQACPFTFGLTLPPGFHKGARAWPLVSSLGALDAKGSAAFVTLNPDCPAGHTWAELATQMALRQLVDGVAAAVGSDADRLYLTGGGPAALDTWRIGIALADRWAAVASIEGAPTGDPAGTVDALWHTGVYLVTPKADRPAPMAAAFAGKPHRDFTVRVDPTGDATAAVAATYADPAFWNWMFAHRRSTDTEAAPARSRYDEHLGQPAVVPAARPTVTVTVDLHALPTTAGMTIVPATLKLGAWTFPFNFGLYLPPGYPHATGYRGGPIPTFVNLHWREYIGGKDEQVWADTLPSLVGRRPADPRHQGEKPADPVPLLHVAPLICIMPHCPPGCRFETPGIAEAIGQLIDQVVPALHADPDRVCLTGVSYGGSSTWVVGQQIADRLAAVVVCDGRRTGDPAATAAALRNVGVCLTAGDVDGDFTNDARVMVAAFTAAGHPSVTYHEVHGGNHFCFGSTYTDPAFWAWLQAQRRPPHASAPAAPLILASATPPATIVNPPLVAAARPATQPAAAPPPSPVQSPAPAPPAVVKADPPKPATPPAPPAPAVVKVDPPKSATHPAPPAPAVVKADPPKPATPPAPPAPAVVKVDPPKPATPPAPPAPAVVKVDPPKHVSPTPAPAVVKADPPKPVAPPQPAAPVVAKVDPPKPATPPAPATPPDTTTALSFDGVHWPTTPGYHVMKVSAKISGRPLRFRFGLYLPNGYEAGNQPWPLVVSLHNKGQIGGDGNGSLLGEGLPFLLTNNDHDGRWQGDAPRNALNLYKAAAFVCLVPQCPTAHTWDDPALLAILDQLIDAVQGHARVDPERTYLTGFSFGASNTWLVASGLPDRFAAIAPIDGRATADPAATVARLAHTAIYQVVGQRDNDFIPEAKRMVAALAAAPHGDFAFHVVPNGNHFCYGSIYTDPSFWDWMFAHRRPPVAKAVTTVAAAAPPAVPVPVVVPKPAGVSVTIDPATLPRKAGYAVIRPTVTVDGATLNVPVGLWLPAGFPHVAAPLPVILSLHNRYAIGMDGTNQALLGEGLPMILAGGNGNRGEHGDVPVHPINPASDVAFIGLFPQCPAGHAWESAPMPEVVDKLIAAVLSGYGTAAADPDRVYATGWSYGASCTWAVASAFPGRFAAVAINDGRAMPDPAAAVAKLRDVAVYLCVGDHDGEFIDEERRMLDALAAARHPNFVQRSVPHAGHTAYMVTYADPGFWGWLLAQRRHR